MALVIPSHAKWQIHALYADDPEIDVVVHCLKFRVVVVECFLDMQDAPFGFVFCQKHSTTGTPACPFYVSDFILQLTSEELGVMHHE